MEQEYIALDLRTILNLLIKNIVFMVLLTSAGFLIAFLYSWFLITPQYEASVTLIVNTRDDQTTAITGDQISSARQLVNTYAVVLTNDSLMEEIISVLRLGYSPASLKSRISAESVQQTQVMRMTMRDKNPHTAQAVLEEIMKRAPELLINTVKAGSVVVLSPPKFSPEPVYPRVLQNAAIGALIGLFTATGYVFIRKMLTNTFVSDEDISRHLEIPILGVIPSVRK